MDTATAAPLILTALLDPHSQARFDRERTLHFPAHINHIAAHVTLFHHLPGTQAPEINAALEAACRTQPPAPFTASGLRFLGRGNAYALEMPDIAALRTTLAAFWHGWLTAQDRQPWHPHVTIQNKVEPAQARRLQQDLAAGFTPQQGRVEGLQLWHYRGGPWEPARTYKFLGTLEGFAGTV